MFLFFQRVFFVYLPLQLAFAKGVCLLEKKKDLDHKHNISIHYMHLLFQIAEAKIVRYSMGKQSRFHLYLLW